MRYIKPGYKAHFHSRLRNGSVVVRLKLASAGVVVVGAAECIVSGAAPLETRPERVELLGLGVERR